MKYRGELLTRRSIAPTQFTRADGCELCLKLSPLPIGFQLRLQQQGLTPPAPPTQIVRDSNGRPMRDSDGTAITRTNPDDAQHQQATGRYHLRLAAMMCQQALNNDDQIRFEAEFSSDATKTADAILKELEDAGWTEGDLARLCDEIARVSGLLNDHVAETSRSFFPLGIPTPDEPSTTTFSG